MVPCAGVASWEERQVLLYHTLRRLWVEAGSVTLWVRTV